MTPPLRLEERGAVDHERARTLASERLHASLPPHDARWLDDHLAGCTACRAVAEGYASDRLELEALRRQPIEPPRDLWARTSAAVEREAARSRGPRRAPFLRRHRPSPVPLGAASGLLVVAVVIGASLLSGQPGPSLSPRATAPSVAMSFGPSGEAGPVDPTPLAVAADVAWVSYGANGKLELNQARVSEVCTEGSAECAPIEAPSPGAIELPEPPRTVVRSPDDESLVLVEGDTDGTGGALTVVPVPTAAERTGSLVGRTDPTTETATPTPPATATPTLLASASFSPPPSASAAVAPPAAATPDPSPTTEPAATPDPATNDPATPDPATSDEPDGDTSPEPSGSPATSVGPTIGTPPTAGDPSLEPDASPATTADPTIDSRPSGSPSPTVSTARPELPSGGTQIAEDVVVVGESAAFSPDGSQFAFSARPEDGSLGSDIYVWQVGEPEATRVTDDHRSVFAGWIGRLVLGSRAVDAVEIVGDPASSAGSGERSVGAQLEFRPEAFLVDPETREEVVLDLARVWRPAVDPTGKRAVYWDGTVRTTETGVDLETAGGRLVVGSWPDEPALPTDADAGPATPAAGTAVPPSAQPSAGDEGSLEVLADGPIRDWDARWNETGTHLAVWIADPDDPTKGRLSLYVVDRVTGRVDVEGALLRDEWALPGFAIGDGRLAWATPEGQDAESSLVKVLAWTDDGIGQVETAPGDEQVVVIR